MKTLAQLGCVLGVISCQSWADQKRQSELFKEALSSPVTSVSDARRLRCKPQAESGDVLIQTNLTLARAKALDLISQGYEVRLAGVGDLPIEELMNPSIGELNRLGFVSMASYMYCPEGTGGTVFPRTFGPVNVIEGRVRDSNFKSCGVDAYQAAILIGMGQDFVTSSRPGTLDDARNFPEVEHEEDSIPQLNRTSRTLGIGPDQTLNGKLATYGVIAALPDESELCDWQNFCTKNGLYGGNDDFREACQSTWTAEGDIAEIQNNGVLVIRSAVDEQEKAGMAFILKASTSD